MKRELITQLEELLTKDAGEVAGDVRALQKEFQKQWTAEFEKARQAFIDEGGKAKDFQYPKQAEDDQFEQLLEQFNRQKKESDAKMAAEQAKNLAIREEIIAKIKDLSQLSENVGAAVKKLQELQTQWKETGQVSSHKYKEIQAEYSKAIEEFYYNLKIYRDLQEHDLKKNFENKSGLIEKLKAVQNVDNIKEAERLVKVYRNEWDEIGPVPNEKWEALKQEYKSVLEDTYTKIKAYYKGVEEKKENNLQAKQDLIAKAKDILASVENGGAGKWNGATEKLLAVQAEWKNIGRANEKENEKVWAEFRAVCDEFFDKKKQFFSGLNEKFAASRKIKTELIEKAEKLQNSSEWQKTTQDLIRLQEDWKKYPSHGDKEEPKLYQRFRNACNTFFEAKKAHFAGQEAAYEDNLKAKEEIIGRMSAFVPSEDAHANREQLKTFVSEWNAAGHVPMKEKKRISDAFYNQLDELYDKLNMDKHEKSRIQFRTRLDRILASENAFDLLRKEADHLKKVCEEINSNLITYENNMGFFKHSKGNPLMKDLEGKIEAERNKLNEFTAKRKLVTEELNKLREGTKQKSEA